MRLIRASWQKDWQRQRNEALGKGILEKKRNGSRGVTAFKSFFLLSLGVAITSFLFPPAWLVLTAGWICVFVISLHRFGKKGLWILTTAPIAFYYPVGWALFTRLCDPRLGPCM